MVGQPRRINRPMAAIISVGPLVLLVWFCADHARVRVAVEQAECDFVECGLGGADLGEDVDAVAVVLDHSLDPADLTLDPLEAGEELVLGGGISPVVG